MKIVDTIIRLIAAVIMLQTLFFKFTGAEESVYIFSKLGMEPWGRYGTGFGELIASVLLFVPSLRWLGAMMGIGLMSGAVFFHLTMLGISVKDDGGYLFFLGITVLVCCTITLFIHKSEVPILKNILALK